MMVRRHTSPFSFARSALFRWLAVAVWCWGAFESTIPDVHDGDAGRPQLSIVAMSAADPASAPAAMHDAGSSRTPAGPHSDAGDHVVHIDHCSHLHTATLVRGDVFPFGASVERFVAASPNGAPSSAALAPRFRPPIA